MKMMKNKKKLTASLLLAASLPALLWAQGIVPKSGEDANLASVEASKSIRVTQRPMTVGARGAYSLGYTSGVMAAGLAGNAEIFQMRWTDATRIMILRSVTMSAAPGTTAFTAGPIAFTMTVARSWSADGGTCPAIVFSTANTNKKRTDFPLSLFTDTGVRASTTAACTAGTKTFDTNVTASVSSYVSSVATTAHSGPFVFPGTVLWQRNTADEYPLIFETNEGFSIRATVPATGTWQFSVNVEWTEIDPALVTGWS
jgi:hypothetical protein